MSSEGELELDFERFQYEEIVVFGGDSFWVKVGCWHRNTEPVWSVAGPQVATLCLDCDAQLPVQLPF